MRTVAVLLVVLFHSGGVGFKGGFVGVSVFFVLSGFLVTGILIEEAQSHGRISLRRFYARRVRRLLPAALVTLMAIAVGAVILTGPFESASILRDARAAAVYLANWHFIAEATDYFGSEIAASPVLHFWSLSIEEQFYLLWPLLVVAILAWQRRTAGISTRMIAAAVTLVALVSAGAALVVGRSDLMRAYYGTDLRAYQLLAGAALAFLIAQRPVRAFRGAVLATTVGLASIVLIGTSALDVPVLMRDLVASLGTVIFILGAESRSGPVSGALAARAPVYLGKISYGIYLWHWPIVLVLARLQVPTAIRWVAVAAAATGIAALSYHFLENPVRRSEYLSRHQVGSVTIGVAASGLVAIGLTAMVWNQSAGEIDWQAAAEDSQEQVRCLDAEVEACALAEGSGAHIMIVGDSYGAHWIPALLNAADQHDLSVSAATLGNCPWVSGVEIDLLGEPYETCAKFVGDVLDRVIPQLRPDLVLLIAADLERRPVIIDGAVVEAGSPRHVDAMTRGARRTIDRLTAMGLDVAVVEMIPTSGGIVIPECLSEAESPEDCDFADAVGPLPIEDALTLVYDDVESVEVLDLDRVVCNEYPLCEAVSREGIVTRVDGGHLTTTYSESLAEPLMSLLRQRFDQ